MAHQQLALHRVDMPLLHGTHGDPALPVGRQFRISRRITACDDDLGIARQHRLHRHGRRKVRQVGKDIPATTKPDDITDKMVAVDCHQGLLPYLVKHAHRRARGIAVTEFPVTLIELTDHPCRPVLVAGQPAQSLQAAGDIGHDLRLGHEHGNPQPAQALQLPGRAAAAPGDHQLRPQRQNRLEIETTATANLRYLLRRRRIVTVLGRAHDGLTGTDRKQQFGNMRRQADDTPGRALQDHWQPAIVRHLNVRITAAAWQQPEQDDAKAP